MTAAMAMVVNIVLGVLGAIIGSLVLVFLTAFLRGLWTRVLRRCLVVVIREMWSRGPMTEIDAREFWGEAQLFRVLMSWSLGLTALVACIVSDAGLVRSVALTLIVVLMASWATRVMTERRLLRSRREGGWG